MKRFLIVSAALFLLPLSVRAAPALPAQFYGAATGEGSVVTASINGVIVASTTVTGGAYGYAPKLFLITDPNNDREGSTITFANDGAVIMPTAQFINGSLTRIDFITASTPSTGGSASGGLGSASTGVGSAATTTTGTASSSPVVAMLAATSTPLVAPIVAAHSIIHMPLPTWQVPATTSPIAIVSAPTHLSASAFTAFVSAAGSLGLQFKQYLYIVSSTLWGLIS